MAPDAQLERRRRDVAERRDGGEHLAHLPGEMRARLDLEDLLLGS